MADSNRAAMGINLLWLALLLDIGNIVLSWLNAAAGTHPNFIVTVLVVLLYAVLTAKVAGGTNWARIVYLLLTLFEVGMTAAISQIPGMAPDTATTGIPHMLDIATPVIRLVGILILFTKPASEWFRAHSK